MVVVLHPQPHAFAGLFEAVELRPFQEVLPDRFPEPLDLAQRHRVMRLAAKVVNPIFRQFVLEPRLAVPGGVLPPVVGQHLLGHAVLAHGGAIDLQYVLGHLAAKQIQPDDIARVVIDEPDQVGVLAPQPKREDVRLPHLIGRRPLEEPRFGRVALRLLLARVDELLLVQRAPHRLGAARQKQYPPQQLRNSLHPKVGILSLQRRDLRFDGGGHLGHAGFAPANERLQPGLSVLLVAKDPL